MDCVLHSDVIQKECFYLENTTTVRASSNNYGKKSDIRASTCTLRDKTLRLAYISSKGDTAFTLFYIKCQTNETRPRTHAIPGIVLGHTAVSKWYFQ